MKYPCKCTCRTLGIIMIFALLSVRPSLGQSVDKEEAPNVILILADDMGIGDLSCINQGASRTLTLDQLVENSIWFNQAYSASSVCTPARAALLTGRYPHRTGAVTLNMEKFPTLTRIDKNMLTIADIFQANGYQTGLVGKWHTGDGAEYHPLKRGFQEFVGFKGYDVSTYFDFSLDVQGTYQKREDQYLTDVLTEAAIDFVRRHKEQRFFLHLAYYAPHRPLGAPQEKVDYYLNKGLDNQTATIYAMIEVMDEGIGMLLEALDAAGIRENTIVIFTSDNGPDPLTGERFNGGLKGSKYTVYEGGIKVPFVFHWKNQVSPGVKEEVIHFTDIFPTMVDLCKLDTPNDLPLDGGSMAEVLLGKKATKLPPARFWQWNRGVPSYSHNAAMREGDWKLIRPFVTRELPEGASHEKPMLYHIKEDPYERKDLSEEFPDIYSRMKVLLEEWSQEVEHDRINATGR